MNSQEQKQSLDDIQNESSQSFNNSDLNTIESIESIESTNVVAMQTVTNCAIWQGRVVCNPIVNQENVDIV
nr:hypothetical protein [Nostoc sp. ChiQUE02]MDZ8234451.1 hypothetical protein [Nostoc sp. ChiQUE02]